MACPQRREARGWKGREEREGGADGGAKPDGAFLGVRRRCRRSVGWVVVGAFYGRRFCAWRVLCRSRRPVEGRGGEKVPGLFVIPVGLLPGFLVAA